MRTCPSCGAALAPHAAFCGECGRDLPDPPPDDVPGPGGTATLVRREIRSQRAADTGLFTPRSRGALYVVIGVVGLASGVWLRFVGFPETTLGPEGYGTYIVTYPFPGLVVLVVGAVAVLAGVSTLLGARD